MVFPHFPYGNHPNLGGSHVPALRQGALDVRAPAPLLRPLGREVSRRLDDGQTALEASDGRLQPMGADCRFLHTVQLLCFFHGEWFYELEGSTICLKERELGVSTSS